MKNNKSFITLIILLSLININVYADEADDMLNELFWTSTTESSNEMSAGTQSSSNWIQAWDTQINNDGAVQSWDASVTSQGTSAGENVMVTENSTTAWDITVNDGAAPELIPLNSAGENVATETWINGTAVDTKAGSTWVDMNGVTITKMPQTGPESILLLLLSGILSWILFVKRRRK